MADQSLVELRKRVERWRRTGGGRGSRIPDQLWEEAASVAEEHGVYATSKALRFNYYSLRDRMVQTPIRPRKKKDGPGRDEAGRGTPQFVELPMGSLCGAGDRAVIELLGERGDRMRIEVGGASQLDVVGLAQAFWRSER
jgi:hypothetical protein